MNENSPSLLLHLQIAEQNREIERLTEEKEQLSRIVAQHSDYPDQSSSFFSVVGDVNNDRLSSGMAHFSLFLISILCMPDINN